jgi:ABC-type dipeptide/oligopeptide/nickel transport system permease subunit
VIASWLVLALLVVAAAIGLFFPPHEGSRCCSAPPSALHMLGTASDGSELLVAAVRGLGTSSAVAIAATALALFFGVLWGAIAAFMPKRVDDAMMRSVDSVGAAPYTLFVVILVVVVRAARPSLPSSLEVLLDARTVLVLCVAGIEWLTLARVVHARIFALRRRRFIEASRMLGVSRRRVLFQHVIPHTAGPLVAYGVLALPSALATEGFFSFLGFGVEAPSVSLGTLIADGSRAMSVAPLTFLLPAGLLVAATVALHVVGATLRDALRAERGL